jgi:hypothetical protein
LRWVLNDLEENNFKTLRYDPGCGPTLSVSGRAGGPESGGPGIATDFNVWSTGGCEGVLRTLKVMNLFELMDQLSHICLNGECRWGRGGQNGTRNSAPNISLDFLSL